MDKNKVELITTTIEAALQPELWHKTVDLIVHPYGGLSGAMVVVDKQHEARISLGMSRFIREDAFEMYEKFMQRGDADDSVVFENIFRMPANQLYSETKICGKKRLDQLPPSVFRDWQKEMFGIEHRYAMKLNVDGPWCDALIIHAESARELRADSINEIGMLSNVITSSLKTYRVMEQLRARFNAALSALDKLGIACFLSIDDVRIIHKNLAAESLIDQADGLSIHSSGQLRVTNTDVDARARECCVQAFKTAMAENVVSEALISIPRPSGKPPYLMVINPLIDSKAELETGLKTAMVFVVDPGQSKLISVSGLVRIGGLTEAESNVCQMLVQGCSTEQIAEVRQVLPNTIRQQTKSIFGKLSCHSRADLIRMAIDTHLPLQ